MGHAERQSARVRPLEMQFGDHAASPKGKFHIDAARRREVGDEMIITSKISARLRKLRKMSRGEISARSNTVIRCLWERWLWRRGAASGSRSTFPSSNLLENCRQLLAGPRPGQLQQLESEWPTFYAERAEYVKQTSNAILSGNWTMLGHSFDVRADIDWHVDPRTGHRFPRLFYADVPRHQNVDDEIDIKYVWELGRQQYFVELARGWLFAQDETCTRHVRRLMLSWIEQNPLYEGVHWTSGLEVAVRAISWIWTLATLAEWDGWQKNDLDRVAASLADHATYLEHHFSFYSSPYNHLIGEATGLYWIAQVLRELPEAARWRSKARQVLEEHGPRQFYADGFCVEQATGYHYFTLGFLAMAIVAARREKAPLLNVERAAHQAFRAGILFQQPDGRWPAIGDVDSARSIPVHHEDFWDFRSLCSLGTVLFDDPSLKRPDSEPGEELFWLSGCEGIERWNELATTEADGFHVLPESGYVLARQGGDWLCFDAGPIAHGLHSDATPSTAHGHLDTLQVLYCHDGQPVLIDPGMPFYFGDRDWVRHFRSAAAHNTIDIEEVEFAREAGLLAWSNAKQPDSFSAEAVNGFWMARGRFVCGSDVTVERSLLVWPGQGLWIADRISSRSPRRVHWNWQRPNRMDSDGAEAKGPEIQLKVHGTGFATAEADGRFEPSLRIANAGAPAGWISEGYGQWTEGGSAVLSLEDVRDALLVTALSTGEHDVRVSGFGHTVRCQPNDCSYSRYADEMFEIEFTYGEVSWQIRTSCPLPSAQSAHTTRKPIAVAQLVREGH